MRATVTVLVLVAYILWAKPWQRPEGADEIISLDGPILRAPPLGVPKSLQRRWAQYAPWFPAGKYEPPPERCTITQVSLSLSHYRERG